MSDERSLGVISDINGRLTFDRLAIFPDCLVLVKGTLGHMVLRSLQLQFGLLGLFAMKRSESKRLAIVSSKSAAELARNPKNRLIRSDQIVDAQLKKSMLSGRLTLKLADGSTLKFGWPKGTNKPKQVAPILRQALGTKLSEVA